MPMDLFNYAYSGNIGVNTKGCIMTKRIRSDVKDITGMKFGDLTALYITTEYEKKGQRGCIWVCKCDCGNECKVFGGHLRAAKRKSCGCRSQARIHEVGINRVYGSYKKKAILRKLEFSISREKFEKLILSNCYYCGREPFNELKRQKTKKLQIKYNGIDRYNPSLGYTNENCVACCYYCNHSKLDLTFDQWLEHLKKLCTYQGITNGNG